MTYKNKIALCCKLVLLAAIILIAGGDTTAQSKRQPVDYVDNFIGVRDANSSTVLGPRCPMLLLIQDRILHRENMGAKAVTK